MLSPSIERGLLFMANATQKISCAECMESMTEVKGELLTRIACANCQYAQEVMAGVDKLQKDRSSRLALVLRRSECGRWCWTRNALAVHRQAHAISRT
jgi:hypothetical protein